MQTLFDELKSRIGAIRAEFEQALSESGDSRHIEALRVRFLGKKSEILSMMKQMGRLSMEERPQFGQLSNELRTLMEKSIRAALAAVAEKEELARLKNEAIDVTLPARVDSLGCRHPIQQTIDEITRIFLGMGYSVADGPEVELARYNFDLLRIPEGHPSRDDKDTFYINDEVLLRTQTSGVQVRVMQQTQPPIRIIAPGKVYRPDTPDATHSPVFHQIEGLVVDRGIAMSDLVGTLQLFARELFGEETKIRLRPHHFPFTEPSCEVDVSCWRCGGKGCATCKGEGFVEVLGAGMVHPWVLEQSGIDSRIYSGFAFGIGAERTAMARYDVDDIRNFYENNVDFLKQFA